MILDISFGKHRADTNWKPEFLNWDEFVDGRLRKVRRTSETMAQYDKMNNIARGKLKDGPAFVGGLVRGGRRKKENVDTRSLITLDADHVEDDGFLFAAELVLGGMAYAIYPTHSYRFAKQKYRLIAPVDRAMSPDEYGAVSRKLAEQIGMDYFDKTTFEVHRLMYLPSCSKDAEPMLEVYEGEPLSVDNILADYDDWRDPLQWPRHADDKVQRQTSRRMEDPKAKLGVVGAFCRCYSISEAIDAFLADVYESVDDGNNRYTHIGSSSFGGLVVYDEDMFAYSHHESDPCSGREVNAFDLVRLHKFGKLDDRASENTNIDKLPSHTAMVAFASQDGKVKRERLSELSEDFAGTEAEERDEEEEHAAPWIDDLKMNTKSGFPLSNSKNVEVIMSNGQWDGVLAYDAFGNTEVIRKELPWRNRERQHEDYEPWLGADDKRLQHWFGKKYEIKSANIIANAFTEVAHVNRFHPIIEYLEEQKWDGAPRIDRLFIDYLGAEDSDYVKEVTRKMFIAAVKRLYEPGCKFDYMLVLVGPQGAGKSTIIQMLARNWFSDSLKTFDSKDAGEHLQSAWIFEFGELAGMTKIEVDEIKQFITKRSDKYRVAYDRVVTDFPRKCVFFGTTNNCNFLKDPTGNRRFWPVTVNPEKRIKNIFTDLSEYDIAQIWAEVVQAYRKGEALTLSPEIEQQASRIQGMHMEEDPRAGLIQEWLETPIENEWGNGSDGRQLWDRVCASLVWSECLHNKAGSMRPWEAHEICDLLRTIPNWKERKGKARIPGYGVQKVFEKVALG